MKRYSLSKPFIPLILAAIFLTSCNGQNLSQSLNDKKNDSKIINTGHPKLVKTQGSTKSDNVWCGLQDKEGNLWFGTTGEGVYRYDGKLFTQFTVKDGLSSNGVYSILEDKLGNIWFGTIDGICRYDPSLSNPLGKIIIPISIPIYIRPVINNSYYSRQSTKNTVWSMLQDKSGKIWFGTGDGIYCYNASNFTRFLNNDGIVNKDSLHLKMIDCMIEDKDGSIWFASGMPPGEEGVCRYDGKSITSFKPIGDGWIRTIKEDRKGNLWFGGRHHGNFIYDGKKFTNFTEKVGIGVPLLVDKNGHIWFSGEEKLSSVESVGGIWRYDDSLSNKQENPFKNYNTHDGMSNYFVWSMLEDRTGNIWIGTRNTGLYKYDRKNLLVGQASFTNFSE